jgi:hypothetical protein
MSTRIIEREVDIYQYPTCFEANFQSLTLGDLHGNAVKLLYFLIYHQVITFKPGFEPNETYESFVTIYSEFAKWMEFDATSLSQENYTFIAGLMENFDEFMGCLKINNKQIILRFLGDEMADRGCCDYFTLRLFKFLQENGVNLTILASNHGCEFIFAYEQWLTNPQRPPRRCIINEQKMSFLRLKFLLDSDIVSMAEVITLINNYYKPRLKLLDAYIDDGVWLFSHAPIQFDAIKFTANYFSLTYEDDTEQALARTIKKINSHFQEKVKNNQVNECCNFPLSIEVQSMHSEQISLWPVVYITWNRWNNLKNTKKARPSYLHGYKIYYVHGHENIKGQYPQIYSLETYCGKEAYQEQVAKVNEARKLLRNLQGESMLRHNIENYLHQVFNYKVLALKT